MCFSTWAVHVVFQVPTVATNPRTGQVNSHGKKMVSLSNPSCRKLSNCRFPRPLRQPASQFFFWSKYFFVAQFGQETMPMPRNTFWLNQELGFTWFQSLIWCFCGLTVIFLAGGSTARNVRPYIRYVSTGFVGFQIKISKMTCLNRTSSFILQYVVTQITYIQMDTSTIELRFTIFS